MLGTSYDDDGDDNEDNLFMKVQSLHFFGDTLRTVLEMIFILLKKVDTECKICHKFTS